MLCLWRRFSSKPLLLNSCLFLAAVFRASILGKAPGLYFGNFGAAWLWASILAILGLNLGKALGLYFDHFGAEYGQGSGPLFCRFWG